MDKNFLIIYLIDEHEYQSIRFFTKSSAFQMRVLFIRQGYIQRRP